MIVNNSLPQQAVSDPADGSTFVKALYESFDRASNENALLAHHRYGGREKRRAASVKATAAAALLDNLVLDQIWWFDGQGLELTKTHISAQHLGKGLCGEPTKDDAAHDWDGIACGIEDATLCIECFAELAAHFRNIEVVALSEGPLTAPIGGGHTLQAATADNLDLHRPQAERVRELARYALGRLDEISECSSASTADFLSWHEIDWPSLGVPHDAYFDAGRAVGIIEAIAWLTGATTEEVVEGARTLGNDVASPELGLEGTRATGGGRHA